MSSYDTLFVVLGNQLFPPGLLKDYEEARFFMAEDDGLCTYVKHHKLKLVLFLASMRSYRDELFSRDLDVHYHELTTEADDPNYETKLGNFIEGKPFTRLVMWEIEDKFFEQRIETFADEHDLELEFLDSPMFVTSRDEFQAYLDESKSPFMAKFYERQRKRLDILVDESGSPEGGQWSFDKDNRKPLPKGVEIPETPWPTTHDHVDDIQELVKTRFANHPGELGEPGKFWLPTDRARALTWLRKFLDERFELFGDYEDALSTRADVLFHSALSPTMNLGLLTPDEIIERALEHADEHDIPINSLEGFVRQIIGWREFIRGIYREYSTKQEKTNRWNAHRGLTDAWWTGDTGIVPLDDAIRKALKLGWNHHIERLMVVGNLMNLCEIEPWQVHNWFMSMYVDSSDWVMGPNVYGMAITSDGGIFATKPYICGSNYLLKMSDYPKPREPIGGGLFSDHSIEATWADVVDGLYWRFVDKQRDQLGREPRVRQMVSTFDRMKAERRDHILGAAKAFLEVATVSP